MKYRNWKIPYTTPQPPEALLRAGYSPLLAVLLALRGYDDAGQARDFLSGGDQSAFDPMLLQDMDKAVARIRAAIERREHVAVFGDYDVDGITSTCVLTDYLRRRGVPVHPYIPDRIEEGYGLNMDAITSLQRADDITLIITVDCGITAIDETNYALQRGIDMVITDHHECSGQAIPNAVAVVDPKRPGSQYPNGGLAGVGVAFKLLCALEGGSAQVLRDYGDLVAIGTVADVMPLTGENRYLVAQGLAQINTNPRPGIRALLHECGAEGRPVTATTIGFTLAPRINAAGRLGKTAIAALLLLTDDSADADRYAAGLCQLNRERQELEQQIWEEASAIACRYPPRAPLVLASDTWHQGVIGIAASRLSEEFHLPTIMICCDGERGKGSCRSWGGFNLFAALESCQDLLLGFGGHELAAGFTIEEGNIPAFRARMNQYARKFCGGQTPVSVLDVDVPILHPGRVTLQEVEELRALEPYGAGNSRPLFCLQGATLDRAQNVGQNRHLKVRLSKGSAQFDGIFFSATAEQCGCRTGCRVDAAFYLQVNEFRGNRSVQMQIVDIRPSLCGSAREGESLHLMERCMAGETLLPKEAVRLLPSREQFVRLWRMLERTVPKEGVQTPYLPYIRALAEELPGAEPFLRAAFCLEIFRERGLVSLARSGDDLTLRLTRGDRKISLEESAYLQTLQRTLHATHSGGDTQ